MRVMGIDYGTVRVGVALSDPERRLASPFATLDARRGLLARLFEIIEAEEVDLVVVGRPMRGDGSPGSLDERIVHFAQALGRDGLEVRFWDEAYSTRRAEERLREAGAGSRAGRKAGRRRREEGRLDRAAAALILQEFLDALAEGCRGEDGEMSP